MYVSLEPLSGNYVDVYPEFAQNLIKKLKNNDQVFLGPDCFNAIIYRKNDAYFQKTPSVIEINKRSGSRSVQRVRNYDKIIVFYHKPIWNFVKSKISKTISQKKFRFSAPSVYWQWCILDDFSKATNSDWVSYGLNDNVDIEHAFNDATKYFMQLSVGMKTYKIMFLTDSFGKRSVYAIQKDVNSEKKRVVRRSLSELSSFAVPENETTCALCCEEFIDTTHLPWLKTSCNHVFHSVCFDRVRAENKCPMCRTTI
tara:strand:- start:109 stop:873 length:765 start_codon:yes stop_codon:yes gene_type:complete